MVQLGLRHPYLIAVMSILIGIFGMFSASRTPTDIFPEIDIPVVAAVWTYTGMPPDELRSRILDVHERALPALVDDIRQIEANSYFGMGVIKCYLQPNADVTRAIAQVSASAEVILKQLPSGITPPEVLRFSATDVPILQLSLSSPVLTDDKLNDYAQNFLRPALASVPGAQLPFVYGGKPRQVMADLNPAALQAKGLSPQKVLDLLNKQNLIIPSGTVKIGDIEYNVQLNNSPETVAEFNDFPVAIDKDATIYMREVGHVRDGFQVQTNCVHVDGMPGVLQVVRKTGGVSTLAVIDGVKEALVRVKETLPDGMHIDALFDQSIFVRAALQGVVLEGVIAAGLTAIMILVFLGNWRPTVIVMCSIPLAICCSLIALYTLGQSLNTMTLGGLALSMGILVDDATVQIENTVRNVRLRTFKTLYDAIVRAAEEIQLPALVSTLSICLVFVPIFLMEGVGKYLFSPMAIAVIFALLASYILSRTLVPCMYLLMMQREFDEISSGEAEKKRLTTFQRFSIAFDRGFDRVRERYCGYLAWAVHHSGLTILVVIAFVASAALIFPKLGMNFFPHVDAGQLRLHVRPPAGTKIEKSTEIFGQVQRELRRIIGDDEIDAMLDNIGLPYSSMNLALSDTATVGNMDGEILISLKENHRPTAELSALLRRKLPERFPDCVFFFQPADMVNQVLNFGAAAPINIRVAGPKRADNLRTARAIVRKFRLVPGAADVRLFQVTDYPNLRADVDRTMAMELGLTQWDVASSVLITLSSSFQIAPNFWLNVANGVSYPVAAQMPQLLVDSIERLENLPVAFPQTTDPPILRNLARITRNSIDAIFSEVNVQPVYDVQANVQGVELSSLATALDRIVAEEKARAAPGTLITIGGQVDLMRSSFDHLVGGIGFAIVLAYLLMTANFASWLDPVNVLMAVPAGLAGAVWMLYLTQTPVSVPALLGSLMIIGLGTSNANLVVVFANQVRAEGKDVRTAAITAGYTRIRPVIMTALAMILGMLPMSLGLGDGGEQNAPLGRAVIGGLLVATVATLVFVPVMYAVLHRHRAAARAAAPAPAMA